MGIVTPGRALYSLSSLPQQGHNVMVGVALLRLDEDFPFPSLAAVLEPVAVYKAGNVCDSQMTQCAINGSPKGQSAGVTFDSYID
ncbi:hypothetical protein KW803_02825 [Candidatus Saccharibacteria bacterium]|nr:hypothetical protein [Candidatus Saccharibacteria bacterium]